MLRRLAEPSGHAVYSLAHASPAAVRLVTASASRPQALRAATSASSIETPQTLVRAREFSTIGKLFGKVTGTDEDGQNKTQHKMFKEQVGIGS